MGSARGYTSTITHSDMDQKNQIGRKPEETSDLAKLMNELLANYQVF